MSDHTRRGQLAEEFLRRFAAAVRGVQLYSSSHPLVARNVARLAEMLETMLAGQPSVSFGIVGGEFVVGETPLPKAAASMADLLRRLQQAGVERITILRDVEREEVASFVASLAALDTTPRAAGAPLGIWPHIEVGRLTAADRADAALADTESVRQLYARTTQVAAQLWDITRAQGRPDPGQARSAVESLAEAVARNRTALLALTALKSYDNYTFTHMVNVSILAMAQARALGLDGPRLRELGLAALMHDIGKVRTPAGILNKPTALDPAEFEIIKRHVVDGAIILRQTPEMPPVAAVVAFEHHLRIDGAGYPTGVRRGPLNLATQLCGIADVYDAMRSQRQYQDAFPTDRILAVLQRNDGRQFDAHLVRRFVQIVGIYPVGNLVRLDTGEAGVVLRAYAGDPRRPQVRVILSPTGRRLHRPYEVALWEHQPGGRWPASVVAPLDPAAFALDPLSLL